MDYSLRYTLNTLDKKRRRAIAGWVAFIIIFEAITVAFAVFLAPGMVIGTLIVGIPLALGIAAGMAVQAFSDPYGKAFVASAVKEFIDSHNGMTYLLDQRFSPIEFALTGLFVAAPGPCEVQDCISFRDAGLEIRFYELNIGAEYPIEETYLPRAKKRRYIYTKRDALLRGGPLLVCNLTDKLPPSMVRGVRIIVVPVSEHYLVGDDMLLIERKDTNPPAARVYVERQSWKPEYPRWDRTFPLGEFASEISDKHIIMRRSEDLVPCEDKEFSDVCKIYSTVPAIAPDVFDKCVRDEVLAVMRETGNPIFLSLSGGRLYLGMRVTHGERIDQRKELFEPPPLLQPLDERIEKRLTNELNQVRFLAGATATIARRIVDTCRS